MELCLVAIVAPALASSSAHLGQLYLQCCGGGLFTFSGIRFKAVMLGYPRCVFTPQTPLYHLDVLPFPQREVPSARHCLPALFICQNGA
jgi:hypothetical protein